MRVRIFPIIAAAVTAALLTVSPAHAETNPNAFNIRVMLPATVADPNGKTPTNVSLGRLFVSTDTIGRLRLEFLPCVKGCTPIVKWRNIPTPETFAGFNVPYDTTRFRITRYGDGNTVTAVSGWYPFSSH